MGDRAQVLITEDGQTGVFLYTHWDGNQLPTTLAHALRRGESRWDDAPYLARVIFTDMVRGQLDELTGFGISNTDTDGFTITVNVAVQTVTHLKKTWTFKEFAEAWK